MKSTKDFKSQQKNNTPLTYRQDGGEKGINMDEIKLTRQQWELIKRYIIYTEHHRQDEIEDWYSINKEQPSTAAKDALTTWQEFDEELKKLLDTIE